MSKPRDYFKTLFEITELVKAGAPIGTVHQWATGAHVKTGPGAWDVLRAGEPTKLVTGHVEPSKLLPTQTVPQPVRTAPSEAPDPRAAGLKGLKTGDIGVIEFIRFWHEATPEQKKQMNALLEQKEPQRIFRLLDDVTHTGIAQRAMVTAKEFLDLQVEVFKELVMDLEKDYDVPADFAAKPGQIHIWGDGHRYVKLANGRWKRSDSGNADHPHHDDIERHRHALDQVGKPPHPVIGMAGQKRARAEIDRQREAHGWGLKKESGMDYEQAREIMQKRLADLHEPSRQAAIDENLPKSLNDNEIRVGTVHRWKDGHYQKTVNGWVKLPAGHPDAPAKGFKGLDQSHVDRPQTHQTMRAHANRAEAARQLTGGPDPKTYPTVQELHALADEMEEGHWKDPRGKPYKKPRTYRTMEHEWGLEGYKHPVNVHYQHEGGRVEDVTVTNRHGEDISHHVPKHEMDRFYEAAEEHAIDERAARADAAYDARMGKSMDPAAAEQIMRKRLEKRP